jgi:hypothetical protein
MLCFAPALLKTGFLAVTAGVPAPRKGFTPARRSTDPDQKSSLLEIGIL